MKELELKINGRPDLGNTIMTVDGKPLQFKKNDFGNLTAKCRTANDQVKIKIYNTLDVGGIVWFLVQICFFLISIFSIFDVHRREKCWVLDFEVDVALQDVNQITLQFNSPRADGKAVNVETNLTCTESANQYHCDNQAKRTIRRLRLVKVLCAIAVVAVVVLAVVGKIIGG